MHVVLATGIYPPDIGGPATYAYNLAHELAQRGVRVTVISYGDAEREQQELFPVHRVSRALPVIRWMRYARALRAYGGDADIVYCFSSVSCGIPLWMAGMKGPKKLLRLGGDFLWERYTDRGGALGLRAWYAKGSRWTGMMNGLLRQFDYIVFSTQFQEELYGRHYVRLPLHGVIENALPSGEPALREAHTPLRLLFMGRFVPFKNLGSLVLSLHHVPDCILTLAGDGPMKEQLRRLAVAEGLKNRVQFADAQAGDAKNAMMREYDVLVLPSYTEISPNMALEARAAGLPVLLTEETGLSASLRDGIVVRPLLSSEQIASGIRFMASNYPEIAHKASLPQSRRGWKNVCDDHLRLFDAML